MGATISSRIEWSSSSGSKKIDYSRSNENILHDILSYVETVATEHPSEAVVEFKRPFVWTSSLLISNFGGLSSQEYDRSEDSIQSKVTTAANVPLLQISKKEDETEAKAMSFKQLYNILNCAGEKKLKEVQLCIEANDDPVGQIMGPAYASTSGVSKALLEAHEQLSRERMKGSDESSQLDSSFRLLLVLNALDVKLLHNSVEKMGKEVRLSPQAVEAEVSVLQQFCGPSNDQCLESLEYTSDTVFSNGCHAPPWRQVYGDICYLKVKPSDGDCLYLTASNEGYFTNKGIGESGDIQHDQVGEVSTTLLALLKAKSPHFASAVSKQEFLYQPAISDEPARNNRDFSRPDTYDVELTEVKETVGPSRESGSSRSKPTSPSKKNSTKKKGMSPTATSAFKTSQQTHHFKGLGVVAEEAFGTPAGKKTRTPKAAATRNQDDNDRDSPQLRAIRSHGTVKSMGHHRSVTTVGGIGFQDDISDSSEEEEEEEEQVDHKPESSADLPSEYWQIQKLIKYLKAGNQTATIIALCSLLDFDLKQETSQMAIRDVGGMDLLVNLLETQHTKCKIGALKILLEITQNTQSRIDITNLGGVPLMILILQSSNRELKCLTAETIANVAKIPRARRIVKQHGGIRKLVTLLDDPGRPGTPTTGERSDTEVACCAASALWSCSKSKKNKLAMLKAGIVPLLAKHLQADDEKLLVPVIGTIQECASEKMYQELIRSEGMIESKASTVPLCDGNSMPVFGLGVYQAQANGEAEQAVSMALQHGYRHIDTAEFYGNEGDVGAAVKKSGIPREDIFVTTKVKNSNHGREATLAACKASLQKLDMESVDLYLIHSPLNGKIVETWDAMVELQKQGLVKSIGVSNFNIHHLEALRKARPDNIPAVNQIEVHPFLTREELVQYCLKAGIVVEAYSPLTRGVKLQDPKLMKIAAKYQKTVAQLLIRWSLQRGFVCIPKSVQEHRIRENVDVFNFIISPEDMATMNGMNENLVTAWDPLGTPWED